jgi:GT2 family glycosyltransferase
MSVVSVVVLTMGGRPEALAAAVASARAQVGVDGEIVLVVNGGNPERSLADVVVEPGENLGIPGGRNAGAAATSGELLCFLDDDGELLGDNVFACAAQRMDDRPDLGAIALRIVDPSGATARRHHPGLRSDPSVSGDVTSFPGGGSIIRRAAFDEAGGLCAEFVYGLEETDLAWRLLDRGWSIRYDADLQMFHPRN